ncbi:hypothetical protein [Leucobacter chromiiresistens]|uniref:hypothetical protein n=1 Tax=Leucobacter chromiiresistens TaxID=1079994 RepID=UPI001FD319DB|nr:hypothetical protein [Leucobacter chromiiresistens]
MPMKETAHAKAIAHTAVGWRRIDAFGVLEVAGVEPVSGRDSAVVDVICSWVVRAGARGSAW